MERFRYKARTVNGTPVHGMLPAKNLAEALSALSGKGYYPITVIRTEERHNPTHGFVWRTRIPTKHLALLTRQLSDLIEADLALPRALEIAQSQTTDPRLADIIGAVRRLVAEGKTLSEAAENFPKVFPEQFVSLVKAGETSGSLGIAFRRLSEYEERREELRSRLFAALSYPALVSVVGLATSIFLITVVVPQFSAMFSDLGQRLPWATEFLLDLSHLAVRYGWLSAILVGLTGFILVKRRENDSFVDACMLRLPLFGPLMIRVAVSRFCGTLGVLLSGGVPMLEALAVSSKVMGNKILRAQILDAAARVKSGTSLCESLKACRSFPTLVQQMAGIGEESNTLEKAMERAALIYEREADRTVKVILSLIEPAFILAVGGVVGLIVVAMLLPIFQIPVLVR